MRPPPGGARLIDPKLRNSREWPKWLASKDTQKLLHGKKVMMFCTGGIRCERAAALVNQMAVVASNGDPKDPPEHALAGSEGKSATASDPPQPFQPQGVYHMQGGIERYLKTFPGGGFWFGKNYLFDKRMDQTPEFKDRVKVEQEVSQTLHAKCCYCRTPWTSYRGKYKCSQTLCGVPVIVCDSCHIELSNDPQRSATLQCELCREGYRAPQTVPDLVALRLKAEKLITKPRRPKDDADVSEEKAEEATHRLPRQPSSDRLFLSRLPLNVSRTQIQEWLQTPIQHLQWLTDRVSGAFYGSCIVQIDSKVVSGLTQRKDQGMPMSSILGSFPGTSRSKQRTGKRRRSRQQPKVSQALIPEGQAWPPEIETEFPPLGNVQ